MSFQAPILLIFHPGALGDGLLALSALRVLRKYFSTHFIIWFGHKALGEILVAAREVHQAYAFDNFTFLGYADEHSFQQAKISALFARCDRAVGWMKDSEGIWQHFFSSVGIKEIILRSPHHPGLRQYHMADRYVETLQPWVPIAQMFKEIPESLLLSSKSAAIDHSNPLKKPLVVLHPGSGSSVKCAPPVLWAKLISGLMTRPRREICLVGGPADSDILRRVQNLLTEVRPTIVTGLDLLSVGRKIQHAQLYIGNDSGLSHLAAHLCIPSILLFGATDPAKWAPRGEHIRIVGTSTSTDGILEKAEEILNGMPSSRFLASEGNAFSNMSCLG
jgi:heptosyltransferase-3